MIVGPYFGILEGLFLFALSYNLYIAARTGWRRRERALVAGIAAAMVYAACTYLEYRAVDEKAYFAVLRVQVASEPALFIAIIEFASAFSGESRSRTSKYFYAAFAAFAALRLALPYTGAYTSVSGIVQMTLPWGEAVGILQGKGSPLMVVNFALLLVALAIGAVPLFRMRARGEGRKAVLLLAYELVLFVGIAFDFAVALGFLRWIYIAEGSYLLFALFQSFEATEDAIKTSKLGKELEVAVAERDGLIREVRLKEARLSHAVKMASLGSWEYDVANDSFAFNDDFYAIFRTSAEEAGGYVMSSAEYTSRFVHPDDAHLVAEETKKALASDDSDYASRLEHRMLYADGEVGIISVAIFLERDESGRVVRTFGVNQDVTERRHAEEKLRRSLAEKETLLRELHHRTKNNMGVIIALLDMQARSAGDEGLRKALSLAEDRIHSMALVHQKLYESGELSRVDLRKYILDLSAHLLSSYAVPPDRIGVRTELDDLGVAIDIAIPCGLILNELFTNALKHAFPEGRSGTIWIRLHRGEGRLISLEVADDGVGTAPGFEMEKNMHMGIMTVRSLGETQLGGSVAFSSDGGFTCSLLFSEDCCDP